MVPGWGSSLSSSPRARACPGTTTVDNGGGASIAPLEPVAIPPVTCDSDRPSCSIGTCCASARGAGIVDNKNNS
eukprot:703126-Amphidinium_carterae.1